MTQIAASHQLYFYQLLTTELGVGGQVPLDQVEELLAGEGVSPADVGCGDVAELLSGLDAFVKVTAFRRGRVVVTILRSEAMEEALARASASQARAVPKGKPWKAKGAKELRPEKPKAARAQTAQAEGPASAPTGRPDRERDVPAPGGPAAAPEPEGADGADDVAAGAGGVEAAGAGATEVDTPPVTPGTSGTDKASASIALTITYRPDAAGSASPDHADGGQARPAGGGRASVPRPLAPVTGLPPTISRDVRCPDALLLRLCEELPLDSDYLALLDQAWEDARPAARPDERGRVRFPLRLPGGGAVQVGMRRRAPTPSGRRWELTEVGAEAGEVSGS